MNVSNSQACLPSNWFPMMHSPLKGCSTATMSMSSNLPRIPPIPVGRNPRVVSRSFQSLITVIPNSLDPLASAYVFAGLAFGSRHPQRLHRRRHRIGEEHGVNPLHDIARHFE